MLFSACEKAEKNDQGHTEACWIYAMSACIEHEALRVGDSIAISRQWLMARELEEQTINRATEKEPKDISMRGVGPEVLRLIRVYGIVPYQFERENRITSSKVLEQKLTLLADKCRRDESQGRSPQTTREELKDAIDRLMPRFSLSYNGDFYYYSMRYTPQQFAQSVMYRIRYRWYAHDEGTKNGACFVLQTPDNPWNYEFINVPYEQMYAMTVASLRKGHAVYWESGKNHESDHAMALVGINADGTLRCLNSYGSKWGDKGYCNITKEQFLAKVCCVGIIEEQ